MEPSQLPHLPSHVLCMQQAHALFIYLVYVLTSPTEKKNICYIVLPKMSGLTIGAHSQTLKLRAPMERSSFTTTSAIAAPSFSFTRAILRRCARLSSGRWPNTPCNFRREG